MSELTSGRGFGSDNYAGVHPQVLQAITEANVGHDRPYGDDASTAKFAEIVRAHFGPDAQGFPLLNGTGANVVAIASLLRRWEAVICADSAHINTDEGGAPEIAGGFKLHPIPAPGGKLTPDAVRAACVDFGFVHRAQQAAVSITQATEMGTIYTPSEIAAIAQVAHEYGLLVHLDGARISNACAALGVTLKEMTTDAGIDVVSLGATKNGAMLAEAVVVTGRTPIVGIEYLRKSLMQLPSKMRFVSAQLNALYGTDLWLENARHANDMAELLAQEINAIDGVRLSQTPQANGVFVVMPHEAALRLMERVPFYFWNEPMGEVRLMCSFDTSEQDVTEFVGLLREEVAR